MPSCRTTSRRHSKQGTGRHDFVASCTCMGSHGAILARLRQIKTKDEIDLLRRLSRIADQSITDALAAVQAGDTEMEIAAHMTRNIYTLGAEHFKLMIVAIPPMIKTPKNE